MSKFKLYSIVGVALLLFAIAFIFFAVNNPQASFPWSNSVTYSIYIVYALLTGLIWRLALKHRSR